MKKYISLLLALLLMFSFTGCNIGSDTISDTDVIETNLPETEIRVTELLAKMSIEDKAGQMVQGEQASVDFAVMNRLGLGSVLSGGGSVPGHTNSLKTWKDKVELLQKAALSRAVKIPFFYGSDAVHGHSNVYGSVIFPHNIGLGAANDTALTEQMGAFVGEEMKLTGILFNFSPCVAIAEDPRWGRTYESFSTDPQIVADLASAYLKGQKQSGVLSSAKHYVADGGVQFGTGQGGNLIDRGNAVMTEERLRETHLVPYKRLIDEGLQCVMVSFSQFNGINMHGHKYLLTDVLKGEMGFKGFIISDWDGVSLIDAPTFDDKVITAVNAGLDMLMQPNNYEQAVNAIIKGAKSGAIPMERIDDAVSRILTVKFDLGLFEDPYLKAAEIKVAELGSAKGREIAKKLVEKSLVLLKNDNGLLPFKSNQKIYVTGPAADSIGVQCGGWTITWQGDKKKNLTQGTTILEALEACAGKYGLEILKDASKASQADIVLLIVGEIPYAEWFGDTSDISLTGRLGLFENAEAIKEAKSLGKPIVTLIVAGRHVIIDKYINDWDSVVMCYLPGTEGDGVVSPLVGAAPFTGKLPMPWYKSTEDIGKDNAKLLFEMGFGMSA